MPLGDPPTGWTTKHTPVPQAVLEKDGWKLTMVQYSAEEVRETAAMLLFGE